MQFRSLGLIILLVLVVILEFLFVSSHIQFLTGLRLIYVFSLLLFDQKKIGMGIVFLLSGSAIIEFLAFQETIGLTGLSMFGSVALITLLYRFFTFPGSTNSYAKLIIILLGAILVRHLVFIAAGYSNIVDVPVIIANVAILFVAITVSLSIRKPQNALRS